MNKPWLESYPEGVPHNIPESSLKPLSQIMEEAYQKFSDKKSFTCMGKSYTFAEMKSLSNKIADYFQGTLGLVKGDKIALMMPNGLQ